MNSCSSKDRTCQVLIWLWPHSAERHLVCISKTLFICGLYVTMPISQLLITWPGNDPGCQLLWHRPLARYVKLWVAYEPGTPGTLPWPPRISDPDMHHSMCVTHVAWCIPSSLTNGFLWSRWRWKHSQYPRRMRNPQFYESGKRPIGHACCLGSRVVKCLPCGAWPIGFMCAGSVQT